MVTTIPTHTSYNEDHASQSPYGCDIHTHTLFSRHAYSTIGECVAAAQATGLDLLGSTDHYSSMISTASSDSPTFVRDYQHFINFAVWPRQWNGVCVMRAVEADIVDLRGNLFGWDIVLREGITGRAFKEKRTLKEVVWSHIDYAIASIHNETFTEDASIAQTTDMYVSALDDEKVIAIGHPGRAGVPFDVDTVLLAAKERAKLIEINEHSFQEHYGNERHQACKHIAERCAELGVMIATSTDAHIACDVGRFDAVHAMLEEIHFPLELIATRSKDAFLHVLGDALGH